MCVDPSPTPRGPRARVRQWWEENTQLVDAVLAFVLWGLTSLIFLVSFANSPPSGGAATYPPRTDAVQTLLLFLVSSAQVIPLAWRRTRPEVAFATVVVAHVGQLLVTDTTLPSNISALIAAYAVARYSAHRRVRLTGAFVAVAAGPLAVWGWRSYSGLDLSGQVLASAYLAGLALLCWYWGDLTRKRRELVSRLREQNDALRRDRDQRARIATQDERARIAREMHDVVAHSLSVVVVQADGAAYSAEHAEDFDRGRAQQALSTISTTAREALSETRHLVGVLRTEDEGGTAPLEYAPTDTLAELPGLVERMTDSGIPATLDGDVGPEGVPREVGLAGYRIVQESLTNVIKHAGPRARVTVHVGVDDSLRLTVIDDGRGAAAADDGHGHGLIGMRERAASVGGSMSAGPAHGGGYRVTATLPLDRREETT